MNRLTSLLGRPLSRSMISLLTAFGVAVLAGTGAQAQVTFPERTVRIVVPYVAGGIADTSARILREGCW